LLDAGPTLSSEAPAEAVEKQIQQIGSASEVFHNIVGEQRVARESKRDAASFDATDGSKITGYIPQRPICVRLCASD
jgi:hypothetical protein